MRPAGAPSGSEAPRRATPGDDRDSFATQPAPGPLGQHPGPRRRSVSRPGTALRSTCARHLARGVQPRTERGPAVPRPGTRVAVRVREPRNSTWNCRVFNGRRKLSTRPAKRLPGPRDAALFHERDGRGALGTRPAVRRPITCNAASSHAWDGIGALRTCRAETPPGSERRAVPH